MGHSSPYADLWLMGVAEGVKTSLCAFTRFQISTWAAISAIGFKRWTPPTGIEHLTIFGDNDTSYTGQASAFLLAKRINSAGITTDVRIPNRPGSDWADSQQDF